MCLDLGGGQRGHGHMGCLVFQGAFVLGISIGRYHCGACGHEFASLGS